MRKIIIRFLIAALVGIGGYFGWIYYADLSETGPLEAPLIDALPERSGMTLRVSGVAEPKATVLVFVDGASAATGKALSTGEFAISVPITHEGPNIITAEQRLASEVSPLSEATVIWGDLSAPKEEISLRNKPSVRRREQYTYLEGTAEPNSSIVVNDERRVDVAADGTFTVKLEFSEGENLINLALEDSVGNRTNVIEVLRFTVDSVPPTVETQYCDKRYRADLELTEEYVCIKTGSFTPVGITAEVPISGFTTGAITSITIDGQAVASHNGAIYQVLVLPLLEATNRYEVVATDTYGNQTTVILTMDR